MPVNTNVTMPEGNPIRPLCTPDPAPGETHTYSQVIDVEYHGGVIAPVTAGIMTTRPAISPAQHEPALPGQTVIMIGGSSPAGDRCS
jgi:hypothetical protein